MQTGNHFISPAFSTWDLIHPKGIQTADGNSGGNNGMLYFIVGALAVAAAVGGFLLFGGQLSGPNQAKSVDVKIEMPKVEKK